jgi:L-iditol 2-dehydrogenase
VVRVEAALTCGTDLKTYRRGHPKIPLPTPMGHEFSGVVAAVGAGVDRFREGDAVACVPTAPCGECRLCRRGRESLCPDAVGRMVFGAFAEYVRLPAHLARTNVFPRPAGLSAEAAAALEPLACVVHGADRVAFERAEHVVLLGDGPIALFFAQVARLRGAGRVLLVGRHPARLAVAAALGAEPLEDPGGETLVEAVRGWTGGTGADVVVECVGRPEVWEAAPALAAVGGEVLLYGGCATGTRASFDTYRVHYDEVDLKGAFHYGRADVRRALDHLVRGEVRAEPLITHRRPLARLEEALGLALSREAVKVAVTPSG